MTTEDLMVHVSQDWALASNVQQRFIQGSGLGPVGDAEDLIRFLFNSMYEFSGGSQTDDATLAVLRVA
jgi:hypothetical protein